MDNTASISSNSTYRRILKSTFIMGGASVVTTLLGIVRTKIIALILGPSGLGLTGIYMTITSLVSTVSALGVRESAVRQIAEAIGRGDEKMVSRTVVCIRRTALFTGIFGLCVMLLSSGHISRLTFGNASHSFDITLLSLTIFFGAVSGGQTALIQGMSRIGDLARLSMIGALLGTLFSVPIIYWLGERGIASYLLIVSATGVLTSWWYCRRIEVSAITIRWRESLAEARPLLKLGFALMLGALMTPCTQYILRSIIIRHEGLSAAGVFHASTTLSVIYVHVILNAMITDFYPRLSAASHDNDRCTSLINDQVEVGLLLAIPGILAIMTFTPFVIDIFYSSRFHQAVDILRWQILGVVLQVVTWPMGFMLRAKGNGKLFFWTELFANVMNLGLSWLGFMYFGLVGIGMAYFVMNLSYLVLIYWIVRINYQFSFSRENFRTLPLFALETGIVFLGTYFLAETPSLVVNSGIVAIAGAYSIYAFSNKTDNKVVSGLLVKIRALFSF